MLERHELRHTDGRRLWIYGSLRGSLSADAVALGDLSGLHLRHDALTDTWVAISPARNTRPEDGPATAAVPGACPLCPGGPEVPFPYDAAVFENRYPSLAPADGRCEVVLYTGRHVGNLGTLSAEELGRVAAIWRDRTAVLWSDPTHSFVMAFENRGEAVGATLTHPHGQIYAFGRMPPQVERRVAVLDEYRARTGDCLACEVVTRDGKSPERVLESTDAFAVTVPYAPRWPFEVHVRARRHGVERFGDLTPQESGSLVAMLQRVVRRYDGLFGFELPLMMVAMEAPADAPDWHLSVEFLPPHRSARSTKARASVETATGLFINDTVPEASATRLRAVDLEVEPDPEVPEVLTRAP